ncbi:MAG: hypothetical protein WAO78_06365 [Roseovarius sp.]
MTPALPDSRRTALSGSCVLAVMVLEIARNLGLCSWLDPLAWAALGATILAAWRVIERREVYFLALCAGLGLAVMVVLDDPAPLLRRAMNQATYMLTFMMCLGLLYEAARTSTAVRECGPFLTTQPPGRRYVALASGTSLLAVLFNAGIVGFLIPMIRGGIASSTPGDPLNPMRERRQLNAVLRGFAWTILWSPTALAPLILLSLLPGANRAVWHVYGITVFVVILTIGAVEDWLRFTRHRLRAPVQVAAFPGGAALRLLAVCLALIGLSSVAMTLTGSGIVLALMIVCPVLCVAWIALQNAPLEPEGRRRTLGRIWQLRADLGRATSLGIVLASAGFVGTTAAALVPEDLLGLEEMMPMPDIALLAVIPPFVALLGLAGLNPVTQAVFLGSLFGSRLAIPVDPTLFALAISCGWALSMTVSPLAPVIILTARISSLSPVTLTWRWNLIFSALACMALPPLFLLLPRLVGVAAP